MFFLVRNPALIGGMLLLTVGCSGYAAPASDTTPSPDTATRGTITRGVTLEIDNQNKFEANIWAYRDGEQRRLGSVMGLSTRTFTFPWPVGELRFVIDFLSTRDDGPLVTAVDAATGSKRCLLTQPMTVEPGTALMPLNLVLEQNLDRVNRGSLCPRQ